MAEILIVEDDKNISKMISITLSMEGHSFDVCYDGLTAEKMIGQKAYDVILLDIMLPGQSGFELLSKTRKRSCYLPDSFAGCQRQGEGTKTRCGGLYCQAL